jgi:CRP-like cAMP-binding protein
MTDHREHKTCGVPAHPESGSSDAVNYFRSLFSRPDADLHGWSPRHTYPSGVQLYQQNDPVTQIYFIESGIVKLSYVGPSGKEVIIGLRRSNWLLGVTHVCVDEDAYSATAKTLTPCSVRCISARAFADQLTTDMALSVELNRMLSREIRGNTRKIITLGSMPASERLTRFLCELISEEDPDQLRMEGRLELPLKGDDLAEIVAVTPQHLYRLLKDPKLRTHINQGKKTLTIVDPLAFMRLDRPEG